METTDILKLKKPSQNDFYNVNDFNANMDVLEAEAAKRKPDRQHCSSMPLQAIVLRWCIRVEAIPQFLTRWAKMRMPPLRSRSAALLRLVIVKTAR